MWCRVLLLFLPGLMDAAPTNFPNRIWAACDFEGRTPDYAWFGPAETNNIPRYPGNRTALGVSDRPYKNFSAVMTGINPVPGPRMGKENWLFARYCLKGGTEATFQHFSLTREDNWHVNATGLRTGKWAELTLNFTREAVNGRRSTWTSHEMPNATMARTIDSRPATSSMTCSFS